MSTLYDADYFLRGVETGKSLYSNYRWMPERTIPMAHRIIRELDLEPRTRILDFGCACGYLVRALNLLDMDAWGIDISEWAVAQDAGGRLNPTLPGAFDLVICKDVLEHIEEPLQTLEHLRERCRTGLIVVPLGDGTRYTIPAYERDVTHIHRQPLLWWRRTIEAAGWAVTYATYQFAGIKEDWRKVHPEGNGFFLCE